MAAEVTVYGSAEGPERKLSELEALLTERNADDGDAPDDAEEEPTDCGAKTCKDEPEDIADSFHCNDLLKKFFADNPLNWL